MESSSSAVSNILDFDPWGSPVIKALGWLVLICPFLVAHSIVAQEVRYSFDQSADFSRFKTYKYVSIPAATKVDDLLDGQIKGALDTELVSKGLTRTDKNDADLYIGYQTAIKEEKEFTSYDTNWGIGPGWQTGWYGRPPGLGTPTGEDALIYTGQLDVDMYDPAHHDLIWRGVVSKAIDPKAKPQKRKKNLAKAVAKLLRSYPPKANS